uniref:Uncharacterized protein n=1 Tax=Caldilinea aerophila TaxID=133453 RepID=A0A7C1FH07_9CHLR
MTSVMTSQPSARLSTQRVLQAGGVAIVGSVIANLIVYWIGRMLAQPPVDFQPLASPVPTIVFTVLFLAIATGVYAWINAKASDPVRMWTIVASVALILSLIPNVLLLINPALIPIGTPNVPAVLVLMVMHVVAYGIAMWVFTKWAHQQ